MMKLLTKELENRFKSIGSQEHIEDPMIICKFFTPWTSWEWLATEYDPENAMFFGLCKGSDQERGYFSLLEMLAIQGPHGLRIERDLYLGEKKVSEYLGEER